uniref:Uncharacterized protein n=1 Tax=Moniliophthora roreri TaxID=221103 RepID=A0A0W0G0L9_MONRR
MAFGDYEHQNPRCPRSFNANLRDCGRVNLGQTSEVVQLLLRLSHNARRSTAIGSDVDFEVLVSLADAAVLYGNEGAWEACEYALRNAFRVLVWNEKNRRVQNRTMEDLDDIARRAVEARWDVIK